jgi:hypothetical protein
MSNANELQWFMCDALDERRERFKSSIEDARVLTFGKAG